MFKRKEIFSNDRVVDPVSNVPIPVVLNPKMEIADPQLPARERVDQYVKFIKEQGSNYCLFTPTGLKVSRVSGVSLSSQVEAIAIEHHLEDESVIAQFGQTYYLANLASGFVIEETLVAVDDFDSSDLETNDVIALSSVVGAVEMGIQVVEARLALTGRGVTKAHLFRHEVAAFSAAGYRHPAQLRRAIIAMSILMTISIAGYSYQVYQAKQKILEQQRRAAVIPPKVGKDSSVAQLRVYGDWLGKYFSYYKRSGLRSLEITSTRIKMSGLIDQNSLFQFYQLHKDQKVLPAYQLNVVEAATSSSASNSDSTWYLTMNLGSEIPNVAQFGLELYENYLVTLQSALPRLGVTGVSQTPTLSEHGIKEGAIEIRGSYSSPRLLYQLANLFIGIPSYAESLVLTLDEQGSIQMDIQMRLVGRG